MPAPVATTGRTTLHVIMVATGVIPDAAARQCGGGSCVCRIDPRLTPSPSAERLP
jgi:hypothetical protein